MSKAKRSLRISALLAATTLGFYACSDMPTESETASEQTLVHRQARTQSPPSSAGIPGAMDEEMCAEDSVIRKCYPLTAESCHERVRRLTAACTEKYEARIPFNMRSSDISWWGSQIGGCTGTSVQEILDVEYQPTPAIEQCQN